MTNIAPQLNQTQRTALGDCIAYLLERLAQHKQKQTAESQTVQAQDSAASVPPGDEAEQLLHFMAASEKEQTG